MRRGEFVIEGVNGDQARLEFEPAPGWEDYVYLYAPDGRRVATLTLAPGESGERRLDFTSGEGAYRLLIAPGHRYRLSVLGRRLIFIPDNQFPALFQKTGEGGPYGFRVDDGVPFTLHATNQNDFEGSPGHLALTDPAGTQRGELRFEGFDEAGLWKRLGANEAVIAANLAHADTARAPDFRLLSDTITISDPAPGFWRVEAGIDGPRSDDIGFWITGAPNVIAPAESAWFAPVMPRTVAAIEVDADSARGPAGEIGAVWDWPSYHYEATKAFKDMGLMSDVHFLPQAILEPENDNPDPFRERPEGFQFDRWAGRMGPPSADSLGLTSLMALTRPAPWASGHPEEFAEFAAAAVAYHDALPAVVPSRLYWQLGNEPNHEVRADAYVQLYRAVGERLRACEIPEVRAAKLGGPAIGNAASDRGALDLDWIEALLTGAEPYVDFVVWNQYRLPRIEDTWRFGEMVRATRELICRTDTDGRLPEIVIGATNMRGGIVLENEKQDGFYGAIWWASAVAHALGTGDVRMMNYFYLVDEGSRRKGLLFSDGRWKPVARMTAILTRAITGEVVQSDSDHSEVAVIATFVKPTPPGPGAVPGRLNVLVVNTMAREVELAPLTIHLPSGWEGSLREETWRYAETDPEPVLSPETTVESNGGTVRLRELVPPRAILAMTFSPALP